MRDQADENVPRGDNVPASRQGGNEAKRDAASRSVDPADPIPDATIDSDRAGSDSWGSEGSGGSLIEKRPPE